MEVDGFRFLIVVSWYVQSVVFGDVNPSGRLPVSFPKSDEETWLKTAEQYPGKDQARAAFPFEIKGTESDFTVKMTSKEGSHNEIRVIKR
jgi:hypothetical protein